MTHVDKPCADAIGTGAPEIDVTSEMIAAGEAALCEFDFLTGSHRDAVAVIFQTISQAKSEKKPAPG